MGGDREFTTPAKSIETSEHIGNLRIHESNGEIHFHDDSNSLKVAIPSADMFAAWEKLSTGQKKKFSHKDRTNGTQLLIEIVKIKRKKRADFTDAHFEIRKLKKKDAAPEICNTTPEFEKFNQFIKG